MLAAFLVGVIVAGSIIYLMTQHSSGGWLEQAAISALDGRAADDSREIQFTVKSGESLTDIALNLEKAKLISSADRFRYIARIQAGANDVRAGEYTLRPNMLSTEILATLRQGKGSNRFTAVEGWRAVQIADQLELQGLATRKDFLAAAHGEYQADFLASRPAGATLEGYLFPDTYSVLPGSTARDIVQRMLDNFSRQFTPERRAQAQRRGLTIHQVITLASIVEREAATPSERPIIASVFTNRMQRGMKLQSDPTVQFALAGLEPAVNSRGYWQSTITDLNLQMDSPYNTYRYAGWPPGPIANPGLAAIEAALNPAQTEYLYFVAKSDGTHAFAVTLREHNENVARYQR